MHERARTMTLALALLAAQAARAGDAPSEQAAPDKAPALSGVEVTAPAKKATGVSGVNVKPRAVCVGPRHPPDAGVPAPEVVSTFPAEGAVVRPGLLVLRFTFNVAMSCDGVFQTLLALAKPCATLDKQWIVLSFDRKMIRMPCVVRGKVKYGLRMNPGSVSGTGQRWFSSLAGLPLKPFDLTFSTSSGPDVTDLETAEAQDKDGPAPSR